MAYRDDEDDETGEERDEYDDEYGDEELPEWWDEDFPDEWLDYDLGDYEYEEFEIGIDYGEDT